MSSDHTDLQLPGLLVSVQVVVERLMAFLRSTSCGGDEVLRRHIASQIVELAEKYAPDTAWYIRVMAEVRVRVYAWLVFFSGPG
jgi:hypothetical protein